jgi:hypothetical protein
VLTTSNNQTMWEVILSPWCCYWTVYFRLNLRWKNVTVSPKTKNRFHSPDAQDLSLHKKWNLPWSRVNIPCSKNRSYY